MYPTKGHGRRSPGHSRHNLRKCVDISKSLLIGATWCNTQLWLKEARNCGQNKSPKSSQITSHFERLNPLTLFFLSESHSKAFKALIIQKFTLDARSEEGLSQNSWATYCQLAWNTCGGAFEAHDQEVK